MLPIWYSTKTPKRQESLILYFSPKPEKLEKDVPDSLRNASQKLNQLYRKHHIYGDHQYLVPVWRDGWTTNNPRGSRQIGNNPTTAAYFENLQLMPCSQSNLSLIRQLQSQPFYIEIGKKSYYLHVLHNGKYYKIPSQQLIPKNWFGSTNDPVITLTTNNCPVHFSNLHDIPWSEIAQELGSPEHSWGNEPLFSKYS